jgi:environmental stress-induced protein Ves
VNQPTLLPKSAFTRSLWKNGLGHTDQIAIEPETADLKTGNYLWRISSASIAQSSAFSIFPDHDRALVLLSGPGLKLVHTDDGFEESLELPPLEPYEFPGDIQSRCELLGGPIQDLSVFFRKGMINAQVEVVRIESESVWNWTPNASWNFIFAVRGHFEVCIKEGSTETLTPGDAFRSERSDESYPVVPHGGQSVLITIGLWS